MPPAPPPRFSYPACSFPCHLICQQPFELPLEDLDVPQAPPKRVPFDLDVAVFLADFAFESYRVRAPQQYARCFLCFLSFPFFLCAGHHARLLLIFCDCGCVIFFALCVGCTFFCLLPGLFLACLCVILLLVQALEFLTVLLRVGIAHNIVGNVVQEGNVF